MFWLGHGSLGLIFVLKLINVTIFSIIPYCSNSEYWTQKRTQSERIHSIIIDVHILKAER